MRTIYLLHALALGLCMSACHGAPSTPASASPAIGASEPDRSEAGDIHLGASDRQPSALPSMCSSGEIVVFSCPLAGRSKTVSLCASDHASRFRYAYGRPGAPELEFPAADASVPPQPPFRRTHLTFGGSTGGTAYSFDNGGYTYVLYSISGTGMRDGGVLVQRKGSAHATGDLKCQPGTISESDDDAVIDATLKWPHDPGIEARGLPRVGK